MRQLALVGVLTILSAAGQALAEQALTLDDLRDKQALGESDRQRIRGWLAPQVAALVSSTDADRRSMVVARENVLYEGRPQAGRSPAFLQALAEEFSNAVKVSEKRAVSQDARVNLFMAVAGLRRPEGIPMLQLALEKDPYPASRYWGARGLAWAAEAIAEKNMPRAEQEMAESAARAFAADLPPIVAHSLFEMLGKLDHERARDVLADALTIYIQKVPLSDPVVTQIVVGAVTCLEKAYTRDVRPEGKARVLMAYATLCAWILPPVSDATLMANLNNSLEKITGERVGFVASDDATLQKLALMEWVEKLLRDRKIPRRPPLPPAIEDAVSEAKSQAAGGATP
jgi:hypothetical protein